MLSMIIIPAWKQQHDPTRVNFLFLMLNEEGLDVVVDVLYNKQTKF